MSHPAFRCEVCHGDPLWRMDRHGDAVVSWACAEHVSEVLESLQRDWEITEISVRHFVKLRDWAAIAQTLVADRIADEESQR